MSKRGVAGLVAGVALALAVLLIGVLLVAWRMAEQREQRDMQMRAQMDEERARVMALEREEARAEAAAVFADPARPTPADENEFAAVFGALGRALERGAADDVKRSFDANRMVGELERIRAFDRVPGRNQPGFREGVRMGIEEKFGTMLVSNELARWASTEVRHVRWSADRQEVVVIAIHRSADDDDLPLRIRWWLVRRPAGWKVYDFEDMLLGLRATRVMSALMTPDMIEFIKRDPLAIQTALAGLREALVLISKHDTEGADAALAPARGIPWPPHVRAVIELAEGAILMGRADAAGALARFEAAEKLLPNMPGNALTRGAAYVLLGRHDDALAAVRTYQKEVGADALSATLEGTSLEAQDKKAEAAAAFRKALDEVPAALDAFDGLRRVLPDAQKEELGERLARLKDPRKIYGELVSAARTDDDDAAIDALLDGLLKVRPNDPRALGDDIRRKVKAEKFADARAAFQRGLKVEEKDDRESVLDAYLFAMAGAGKALDAYGAVPPVYAAHAFRTLAEELDDAILDADDKAPERTGQLSELVAAHRKREPSDPWAWYFEAAVQWHAKEYERAEKLLAAGALKLPPARKVDPDDPDPRDHGAEQFRWRRVECLFKLKKGLAAYRDIGPPEATFGQLAGLYDEEKDYTGLTELLAAHRERVPNDTELVFWQAHVHFRKDGLAVAIPLYKSYLRDAGERGLRSWQARDEMIRALLRTRPMDAGRFVRDFGPEKVNAALRAAVAAALDDRAEVERLLAESARDGRKTWFYTDPDFRKFISGEKFRELRTKYPDPSPPSKADG